MSVQRGLWFADVDCSSYYDLIQFSWLPCEAGWQTASHAPVSILAPSLVAEPSLVLSQHMDNKSEDENLPLPLQPDGAA